MLKLASSFKPPPPLPFDTEQCALPLSLKMLNKCLPSCKGPNPPPGKKGRNNIRTIRTTPKKETKTEQNKQTNKQTIAKQSMYNVEVE